MYHIVWDILPSSRIYYFFVRVFKCFSNWTEDGDPSDFDDPQDFDGPRRNCDQLDDSNYHLQIIIPMTNGPTLISNGSMVFDIPKEYQDLKIILAKVWWSFWQFKRIRWLFQMKVRTLMIQRNLMIMIHPQFVNIFQQFLIFRYVSIFIDCPE